MWIEQLDSYFPPAVLKMKGDFPFLLEFEIPRMGLVVSVYFEKGLEMFYLESVSFLVDHLDERGVVEGPAETDLVVDVLCDEDEDEVSMA